MPKAKPIKLATILNMASLSILPIDFLFSRQKSSVTHGNCNLILATASHILLILCTAIRKLLRLEFDLVKLQPPLN